MSNSFNLKSYSAIAGAVTFALGSISTFSAQAADLSLSKVQPTFVKQVNSLTQGKKSSTSSQAQSTYIVRLEAPSIASYQGGIKGMKATSLRVTGKSKLDGKSPAVKAYRDFLSNKQNEMMQNCEQSLGRSLLVKHRYSHAFNGMAMVLSADEAEMVAALPGVVSIEQETFETLNTDAGPGWIGAKRFWRQNGTEIQGNRGEGAVVAILDSGINHDHPSFADVGGDGYDHVNPLGSGNYLPGSYCDVVDPTFCNDKLIGAWDMVQSGDDPTAPEDMSGHGTHTAATTAGNVVKNANLDAPTTSLSVDLSGVAPHANIIAYDVCIDSCPSSALLAAVDQVVIDSSLLPSGIQALNYSISGGENPYNDAMELGFLNATAAGIYVAASGGNSGPGPETVAHRSPWVSTTAAMTHNRSINNSVADMVSDGASLANLEGKGFTAAYGPAAIVYAGDFPTANGSSNDTDPAQCLEPFPAGHFSGEIVICDRGAIARTEKGENALAGGAGGMVLANAEANGEATVGDSHFLPAVHLGFSDGQIIKDWVAANTNTSGTIAGTVVDMDRKYADITAGFSSRGPNTTFDVIKPDIGGPGVDILAAYATLDNSGLDEYAFLSGTSMSSPHNAGAGALISGSTDWTPYEIKSALMMTSKNTKLFKDDGVTPADPFDVGAGRLDLTRVLSAGLVLDETPENFLAADPAMGGDPKTLNIASMQNSSCSGSCSWTRTVTNVSGDFAEWRLRANMDAAGTSVTVSPRRLALDAGESAEVTVSVDTTFAAGGWAFGQLDLVPGDRSMPRLHMPIAALSAQTSSPFLSKTVDMAEATVGDVLTYTIDLSNGPLGGVINITDELPDGVTYVADSAMQTVTNGTTDSDFAFDGTAMNWSGTLAQSGLGLADSASPFGYFSLGAFGTAPIDIGCPDNCDDGGLIFDVPDFTFNGESYNQVIWSTNGTLEMGIESLSVTSASNTELPNVSTPNNLLAPLWTDLDFTNGGNFYVATLGDGVNSWTIYEWENVARFGTDPADPANTHTVQVWIQADDSGNIWYVYGPQGDLTGVNLTVGVENADGTTGSSSYFNGAGVLPAQGSDLKVESTVGGQATLSFQADVDQCDVAGIVNQVQVESDGTVASAIAATACAAAP